MKSNILVKPLITEKTIADASNSNEYTFLVHQTFSKPQIKEAVEKTFEVKVVSVRTGMLRGKTKRSGRRLASKTSDIKKAFVKLAEKDKIELFEVKEKKKK